MARADCVVAIEIDSYLIQYLRRKFQDAIEAGRLILVEGDVLQTDLSAWGPAAVAGNLPYYITSPILEKLFEWRPDASLSPPGAGTLTWTGAVFLVQAEVAARLAAAPGTRDFGYLTVQAQFRANVEVLFEVPRVAFRPPPKVESAVVRLEPRDRAAEFGIQDRSKDRDGFLRFASACFRHKRKTLRNNLTPVYGKERVEDVLSDARVRAEQLGVAELAALYRKLAP